MYIRLWLNLLHNFSKIGTRPLNFYSRWARWLNYLERFVISIAQLLIHAALELPDWIILPAVYYTKEKNSYITICEQDAISDSATTVISFIQRLHTHMPWMDSLGECRRSRFSVLLPMQAATYTARYVIFARIPAKPMYVCVSLWVACDRYRDQRHDRLVARKFRSASYARATNIPPRMNIQPGPRKSPDLQTENRPTLSGVVERVASQVYTRATNT